MGDNYYDYYYNQYTNNYGKFVAGQRYQSGEIHSFRIYMQLLSEPYVEPLIYIVTCTTLYGSVTHSNFTRNRKELGQLLLQETDFINWNTLHLGEMVLEIISTAWLLTTSHINGLHHSALQV